jgi:hypothetical protein
MSEKDTQKQVPNKNIRIPLYNHQKACHTLQRLIREFRRTPKEERDVAGFRAMIYALNTLLDYFKFSKGLEVEERILAIEKRLEEMGK